MYTYGCYTGRVMVKPWNNGHGRPYNASITHFNALNRFAKISCNLVLFSPPVSNFSITLSSYQMKKCIDLGKKRKWLKAPSRAQPNVAITLHAVPTNQSFHGHSHNNYCSVGPTLSPFLYTNRKKKQKTLV